ncbi:MAG: hypothetical protein NXI24_00930 [bacterium]|nr:hypothetical protein [bacterium]
MYQKTIAFILAGLLLVVTGGAWTAWTADQGYTAGAGQLDYLARESLPEDLPDIPGPPRSAKRTLYDTLRGGARSAKSAPAAADRRSSASSPRATRSSGKDLPLLPVRSAEPSSQSADEIRASREARLERVAEPVPQPRTAKKSERAGPQNESVAPEKKRVNSAPASASSARSNASGAPDKAAASQAKRPAAVRAKRAADRPKKTTAKAADAKQSKSSKPSKQSVRSDLKERNERNERKTTKKTGPGSKRTVGKYDPKIAPTPRGEFRYYAPQYYRGIYLNSGVVRSKQRYDKLLEQSRKYKINTLVVDVQPRFPAKDFIRAAREGGFYLVARVVVFEGGLKQPTIPEKHLSKVLDVAEQAARSGFMEIQLDYIRFADRARIGNLSFKQRYEVIAGILKRATDRLRPLGVRVGADIFGRIPFNRNDRIGQRMEVFAEHLDTLYPMLYPSHFYGDPSYIKDPYKTIYQGQKRSIDRVGDKIRTIAYIQGFKMKIGPSGLSYHNYIRKQLDASADSGGAGFVVWNARSRYAPFFKALADHDRRRSR